MTCEAGFMGGPAHGVLWTFPDEEPPTRYMITVAPAWSRSMEIAHIRYRREVSQLDDGPLWVFVLDQDYERPSRGLADLPEPS